eukprot:2735-Eustigmatos_ZCMA.PRE.1
MRCAWSITQVTLSNAFVPSTCISLEALYEASTFTCAEASRDNHSSALLYATAPTSSARNLP